MKQIVKISESELKDKISRALLKEMANRRGYIVTVDFDGTVVTHEYPRIGHDIGAVPVLKKIVENGGRIILDTMRGTETAHGDTLTPAVNWFKENGIPLWGVQSNPTQSTWTNSTKVHANISIDDRNAGAPLKDGHIDWKAIEKYLVKHEFIEDDDDNKVTEEELMVSIQSKVNEWLSELYDSEEAWNNEKLMSIAEKLENLVF